MFSISVVIPTRNRPDYLVIAVKSALDQTLSPLEVIVVDDASENDENLRVVTAFDDPRLRFEKHPTRRGGNAARNTGIKMARGNLVAFLDDDDRWLPLKLEKQVAVFQTDTEIGAVYCGMGSIDLLTGEKKSPQRENYPTGYLFQTLLVHDVTSGTPTYVIRRECFEKVGFFDESLPVRQDWDMWIRVAEFFKIGCVAEILVYAGEHHGERVRSNPQKSLQANRLIFQKYASARRRLGYRVEFAAISALCYTEGTIYTFSGNFYLGILSYLKGIFIWPFYPDNYTGLIKAMVPLSVRPQVATVFNKIKTMFLK